MSKLQLLLIGVFIIYLLPCLLTEDTSTLQLVQLIYRHGDRLPVHTFPTDPHRLTWPPGTDKLTSVGMRQLFELGKYLRRRYGHFIPKTFDASLIYVRSTGFQRTVKSAYCKLAGFYSENENSTVEEELSQILSRDIYVATSPPSKDLLLRIRSHCPTYERLWDNKQRSEEWLKLESANKGFFRLIGQHTGIHNVTLMEAFSIADPVSCWISHNKSFPRWMTPHIVKRLLYIGSLKHYLKFSTPQMQRLRGGPLIKLMLHNMEIKMNNTGPKSLRRMYSFSAHDGTISAVMNYLGVFNMKKSPYASCLMFELHSAPSRYLKKK